MKTETRLSVVQMCAVAGFARAALLPFLDPEKPARADRELREEMHEIALEWPSYGSRRMTHELKARGWEVNRKRVQRLMREDNLLCVGKRKFVATTDSAHGLKVYPHRAGAMILTDVDQLWISDISYIRLDEEFVYLAVWVVPDGRIFLTSEHGDHTTVEIKNQARAVVWKMDEMLQQSAVYTMHLLPE